MLLSIIMVKLFGFVMGLQLLVNTCTKCGLMVETATARRTDRQIDLLLPDVMIMERAYKGKKH